jgi:hypothetical protein
MPEYQEILTKLKGYGVDVDHYITLVRTLFGIPDEGGVIYLPNIFHSYIMLNI